MKQDISDKIVQYAKELRLPVLRRDYQTEAKEAAKDGISYEEYLLRLMEKEFVERLENRKKAQIRIAGFPQKLYLHTLKK